MSLAAIRFLHEQRHILFHGHEPLDTDTTATLEGEAWLLQNGYTQAEGVAHLDQVPETGALVEIGYPKFGGGVGGYARFIAICPPDWKHGVTIGQVPESPLARAATPLHWDTGSACGCARCCIEMRWLLRVIWRKPCHQHTMTDAPTDAARLGPDDIRPT